MKREFDFFESPKVKKSMKIGFFVILIILALADLFFHKHAIYSWERFPGSYAVYGFLSCLVIVALSKLLAKIWLRKREDYYD